MSFTIPIIPNPPPRENVTGPPKRKILTACIDPCVHVAGAINFGNIAISLGFDVKFLGTAKKIPEIIDEIISFNPDIIGLSYRLTPEPLSELLQEFFTKYAQRNTRSRRIFFAGTPPVIEKAKSFDRIEYFFMGGESPNKIIRLLKGENLTDNITQDYPIDLLSRIEWKRPFPLLRAHFGLPDLQETIAGIKKLADADVLDVISIAPDQNTQENYFQPDQRNEVVTGAGGVPIRTQEDLMALHEARLYGNRPLLRIYAGTRAFIRFAEIARDTIQNAWAAIPIFWFNQMDGRGSLTLEDSIKQHIEAIRWHADQGIPVEINDPHHWGLRDAPDSIVVADSFLCAQIAKQLGVRNYVAQYMFNSPPNASIKMDLAKMLAMRELTTSLEDNRFRVIRQVRTGLASMPLNINRAKGQLALSTVYQLALQPHIVHVVTHSESHHAALPQDIIESCQIVNQVITKNLEGLPNPVTDPDVVTRKDRILQDAKTILHAIDDVATSLKLRDEEAHILQSPLLTKLVTSGLFDAPHLVNNLYARGSIRTKIVDGACVNYDPLRDEIVSEKDRIKTIFVHLFGSENIDGHLNKRGVITR